MIDLPGLAIKNFYDKTKRAKLYVHDNFGPKVEMPVSHYFRNEKQLPVLEKKAMDICQGKILDVGAGAGSHPLILQRKSLDVTALEISPAACETMQKRGVKKVVCDDIFTYERETFDTLLLLMNGIGLCGNLDGFRKLVRKAKSLLNRGGILIFDSSDIAYMYEEEELPTDRYYGEVSCRYEYQKQLTDWFSWLYLDKNTMVKLASEEGWTSEIILEDDNDQYLAKLYQS
ncbi:class I SAM-dependent methyltransferase [Epilithonimonas arachidiradicis]|uniref:Methyltransferase family protein n=1 Tax=Epilithonimonas arachidiradicis TaxID=1617282 RepID=A0A420DDQ8_9FLAO|nr:class I SAM-dependent methyltransferase [Epilithonimonas arachidiradicis]RKE89699.1 methyltransferase family protein [Epilithonimonas arachidiradicis]GGG44566.1 SAM-dependent methyltransferase [Epilithonimonas arachidiradicis]